MNIISIIHVYLLHCIERIFNNPPAVSFAYGMIIHLIDIIIKKLNSFLNYLILFYINKIILPNLVSF